MQAAVDQAYLYKVLRGFGETGLPQQTINMLIVMGFCMAVLAGAVLWYNNQELKKRLNPVPPSWMIGKAKISKVFETALVYRSKIEISFHSSSEKRKTIPCSISDLTHEILLEMPTREGIGKSWIGRQIDGFFHVPTKQAGLVIFYHFTSVITDISSKGSSYTYIHTEYPKYLEQTQKREFLRVSPPSRFYDYVNIIPDSTQGMKAGLKFITTSGEYSPGFMGGKDSRTNLIDISGGGVSLEVTHMSSKRAANLKLSKGQSFLLLLGLVDTGNKGIVRYLFTTRIRRIFIDPTQGKAQIGLSFENQFLGFDDITQKPKWATLKNKGSTEMDDWSYNLHLELYREGTE
ncbi:hypothetical protein SAMN05660337_2221 [Maridesulfovibrio ferrireducens]|uniref:Uncharacterized protein n=1 Tax=Maridesulfovibrio ferrireducens TaxID=246191 RepID=A0A1G9HLK3_9BACT|nr:hypothetical protein [Maridesulfovibrio ferrireducens]SDL13799.1 hypothetical protein SAMN05660337_2221 [Maridesulfovibrio ferrireducens]